MTDLMDITDDSDPLNVTKGNPGLKPSFTNSLRLFYNTYLQNHQRAIMTYINYQIHVIVLVIWLLMTRKPEDA